MKNLVIVGGGHAAVQCAASLRDNNDSSSITLISSDNDAPYHRPPISKKYPITGVPSDFSLLRPAEFFEEKSINLHTGTTVARINIEERHVVAEDGTKWGFDNLVLATGSAPRPLDIPGIEHALTLYSLSDARAVAEQILKAKSAVVIGAGFIGLEIAATLNSARITTTVIESAPRILARSLTASLADQVHVLHETAGLRILCDSVVEQISSDGVMTNDGFLQADLVFCGTGSAPRTELATKAGLTVTDGIEVDRYLETSVPGVYAIGDIASFEKEDGTRQRYESVQNANDQARTLAKTLSGNRTAYDAFPWFWSDQGKLKLQMAGVSQSSTETVIIEGDQPPRMAAFCFKEGVLCAVETINWPAYHALSRKALSDGRIITHDQLGRVEFNLKSALK